MSHNESDVEAFRKDQLEVEESSGDEVVIVKDGQKQIEREVFGHKHIKIEKDEPDPEEPESRLSGWIVLTIVVLVSGLGLVFKPSPNVQPVLVTDQNLPENALPKTNFTDEDLTLGDNLSGYDLNRLTSLKETYYIPKSLPVSKLLITDIPQGIAILTYQIGETGDIPYSVTVAKKLTSFTPPNDCGPLLPGGSFVGNDLGCKQIASPVAQARTYLYTGPTWQQNRYDNGERLKPLTIYADYNDVVVIVTKPGANQAELLSVLPDLVAKKATQLPYVTVVNFQAQQ